MLFSHTSRVWIFIYSPGLFVPCCFKTSQLLMPIAERTQPMLWLVGTSGSWIPYLLVWNGWYFTRAKQTMFRCSLLNSRANMTYLKPFWGWTWSHRHCEFSGIYDKESKKECIFIITINKNVAYVLFHECSTGQYKCGLKFLYFLFIL